MDTVRAFIAIELDKRLCTKLGELQDRLRADVPPGLVRWVRPEGMHLTLKFLGDVPAVQVSEIAQAVQQASAKHASFVCTVSGLGCFPNTARPRVVWVGIEEPGGTLLALQRDVDHAVSALGFAPEQRRFHPHLTLGRVKSHDREAVAALGEYVSRARVNLGSIQANAVHLMRSDLLPGGAVYTALSVSDLGG
jgi:2'-5' RNA ligase